MGPHGATDSTGPWVIHRDWFQGLGSGSVACPLRVAGHAAIPANTCMLTTSILPGSWAPLSGLDSTEPKCDCVRGLL